MRFECTIATIALVAVASLGTAGHARAQTVPELDLKVAIIFNFALFTSWPDEVLGPPGRPIVICHTGDDAATAFSRLAGKTIDGRKVEVRRLDARSTGEGCHVVYWRSEGAPRGGGRRGTLTIGESAGFVAHGGMIRIGVDRTRIVFDINLDAVRVAGLKLSPKLLRLAQNVRGSVNE